MDSTACCSTLFTNVPISSREKGTSNLYQFNGTLLGTKRFISVIGGPHPFRHPTPFALCSLHKNATLRYGKRLRNRTATWQHPFDYPTPRVLDMESLDSVGPACESACAKRAATA